MIANFYTSILFQFYSLLKKFTALQNYYKTCELISLILIDFVAISSKKYASNTQSSYI